MSEGLSQDDFRRLMATPRRPNNEQGDQSTFKAPAPKSTGAIFAAPRSIRKNNYKKPIQKKNDDSEEEEDKSNYRDRAAERRLQKDTSDDSQLSTEELLRRTQAEVDEELDPKQLYEQSKYLGGDVKHTHLVKGLDFALLRKVRNDLENKKSEADESEDEAEEEEQQENEPMEEDLDEVLEKFERGEKVAVQEVEKEEAEDKPKFLTVMAKNIYDQILVSEKEQQKRVELFEAGKMAYVFELADEVGHYSDAFAVPTSIIRSKTDMNAKLSKSGWSEDSQAETNLVIGKIAQVMESVRRGDRHHSTSTNEIPKQQKIQVTNQPIAIVEDTFMGDIFADVGRDYELDESSTAGKPAEEETKKSNYFQGLVDEDEDMTDSNNNDAANALLSQVTAGTGTGQEHEPNNKRKRSKVEIDEDSADIDMFGLSSSALPTSFEEHTAYQSDDDEENSKKPKTSTQFIDQGTNRNKKAQLTRWDFDTDEEWQNYKSSIEIHPKSAFQFGVKQGDGRKRNREKKSMNDKQRLDRDYQQVKSIMSKKYGKSLDK